MPLTTLITESDHALRQAMRAGFDAAAAADSTGSLGTGWIDVMRVDGDQMGVNGWMLFGDGWPDVVEFVAPTGKKLVAEPELRPDLGKAFPEIAGSENGGYRAVLPRAMFAPNGEWNLRIRALRGADEVFSCSIRRGESANGSLKSPRWSGQALEV
jgi:hypothetical protein